MSNTPNKIQIPNKAIKPIPAEILKLVPVMNNAAIPPTIAKGTLRNTRPASLKFPNILNKRRKINNRLIGTICCSLLVALCWFSKSPCHTIEYPDFNLTLFSILSWASFMALPISLPRTENFTAEYLDRKSTRSELQSPCNLVCRLLLERKKIRWKAEGNQAERARKPTPGSSPPTE